MSNVCNCSACIALSKAIKTGVMAKPIRTNGCCVCDTCCSIRSNQQFSRSLSMIVKTDVARTRNRAPPAKIVPPTVKTLNDLVQVRKRQADAQHALDALWQEDSKTVANMLLARCSTDRISDWAEERWYASPQHQAIFKSSRQFAWFVGYMSQSMDDETCVSISRLAVLFDRPSLS